MELEYELTHYHGEPMDEEVTLTVTVQAPYTEATRLLDEIRQAFLELKYGND